MARGSRFGGIAARPTNGFPSVIPGTAKMRVLQVAPKARGPLTSEPKTRLVVQDQAGMTGVGPCVGNDHKPKVFGALEAK